MMKRKVITKAPLSVSDVRRSQRIKLQDKGFKHSSCSQKNCLACSADPPILLKKVIRNLGESFCKMDVKDLSNENLSRKKKSKVVVGAGTSSVGAKSKKDKNHEEQK